MFTKEIITLLNKRNDFIRKVNQDYRNGKDYEDGICKAKIDEINLIENSLTKLNFSDYTPFKYILDELNDDTFDVNSVVDIPFDILDSKTELPYKDVVQMDKLVVSFNKDDKSKLNAIAKSRHLTAGEVITYCLEKKFNNGTFDIDIENKLKLKTTSYNIPKHLNEALQKVAKENNVTKNSIIALVLEEELGI